jgi:predicted site-specific integrase-resolvase
MITQKHCKTPTGETFKRLLSRRALAERWGCTAETVKNWERAGKIKSIRLGTRSIRYELADVLAFEAAAEGRREP